MAMRIAARYVPRRFSSSGKILGEEEKAAENVYIKKIEREKLEKLALKWQSGMEGGGAKPEGKPPTSSEGTASDVKPSAPAASTTSGVSTDEFRNFAVVAGVFTGFSALGWWYFGSKDKKTEEVHD